MIEWRAWFFDLPAGESLRMAVWQSLLSEERYDLGQRQQRRHANRAGEDAESSDLGIFKHQRCSMVIKLCLFFWRRPSQTQ